MNEKKEYYSNLLENTIFINLNERTDRLEHILNELPKIGIKNAERFNAIRTKNGAVGCTLSHIKCLEIAKQNNYPHVFICEDDITFLNPDVFKKSLQKFANSNYYNEFDVLLLAGNNCPPFEKSNDYCIRISNCRTTTGYVVKQHYYDKLIQNFKDGVRNLIREPDNKNQYAVDMFWRTLQINDKWYLIIPLTVVQKEGYSDIENRLTNYKHLMTDLEKEWLVGKPIVSKFHNMTYMMKS
jgi:GR25 family glycosyltransferase involved in LPS biosynthesis